MLKVAFFDVDGTLVSHENMKIPESTRAALKELKSHGFQLVVATGRMKQDIAWLLSDDLEFDGYITVNGQIILDDQKNVLSHNPISKEDTAALAKAFSEEKVTIGFVGLDRDYINHETDEIRSVHHDIGTAVTETHPYDGSDVYMVRVYGTREDAERVFSKLHHCRLIQWHPKAYDIVSKDAGKLRGVKQYLASKGIARENTVAFGDDENDIEMMNYVAYSIAMGNGIDRVKQGASFITTDIDADGVYNGVQKLKTERPDLF